MNRETMLNEFPKLMERLEEDIDELRYLLVIDPNEYDPEIDDEFDVFDPQDYNYLVYVTETLQEAMGKERFEQLHHWIADAKIFDEFLASEEDLYGVMASEDEEGVGRKILALIESKLD